MKAIGLTGALAVLVLAAQPALAELSKEAAIEHCRMSVGRPIVMACMQGGMGNLEACRAKASPKVKACVLAKLTAANGRANVAVAIPTEAAPKVAQDTKLPAGFVAPPRTISDITAILDSEKPDLKKIEETRADADAQPTGKESKEDLAQFYFDRSNARAELGRVSDAIADSNKALEVGQGAITNNFKGRIIVLAGLNYIASGDPKKALELYLRQLREVAGQQGAKGYVFGANRQIAGLLIQMGDLAQADAYVRKNATVIQEARTSGHPAWRNSYAKFGQNWESEIEFGRAMIAEARGQFAEAEAAYRLTEQRRRAAMKALLDADNPPSESVLLQGIDFNVMKQARMKARQGRLAEAEVDARRALLSRLKDNGKYHPQTPRYVAGLAAILVEEGRYDEAEKLMRVALEINETLGIAPDAQSTVDLLSQYAGVLNLLRKRTEAAAIFDRIDKATAKWEPARRTVYELNPTRIQSLYNSGQVDAGLAAAGELVKRLSARVGESHFDTASAHGTLAAGLMRAGRDAEAAREFKAAIPIMLTGARENADDENTTVVAARTQRLQNAVEAYFLLLTRDGAATAGDIGEETFALADAVRGQSVQQALAASSARAAAKDPKLADLVRKEQDLVKQVNAQLGTLNNVLSLPSTERDEKGVQAINASINTLRSERNKARVEINQKFPAYADLVSPRPPSVADIRALLADGEAMLSFYFGQNGSFVWAVPKNGPVAFAQIKASSGDIESKVRKLREALEPQAAMISDIPPFDVALGYELYSLLLQPVESGWKDSKNLVVVTNGALGLLPLSLLPTAPATVKDDDDPLFASYRNVPWLARTHAVTTVPSAAALRTLRQLPPGKPGRGELVAFGDPLFNTDQQAEAQSEASSVRVATTENVTRGMPLKRRSSPKLEGVDSAEIAQLPRLPDTSEELKSIALALQADPSQVLHLGKDATEGAVKTMNLSGFKVLAFATHGLVPGELNGLTQPALALSAPSVTGEEGDGLLTMEEILGLKLDADWVILSACNTGTGAGAGAEAASGLGRAFFYAGTRALLVTNWSVHSQSARDLVTDLFKRQAADAKLPRSEALRQAMMALVDGPGYLNAEGKTEFTYAHPLFWAPYTIIGDGGVR